MPSDARPYILPLALYLIGTSVASWTPSWYPWAYMATVAAVAATLAWYLPRRSLLVPHRQIGLAIGVGLIGIGLWLLLSHANLERFVVEYLPQSLRPGARSQFNPWEALPTRATAWAFIGVRLFGLAVLVPLAEELFWRGFLLRWLQSPDWTSVPLGKFDTRSFGLLVLFFALVHPELLAAAVYAVLLNLYFGWKRDLWGCVVAHAVSNLTLGIYVLATGNWFLW